MENLQLKISYNTKRRENNMNRTCDIINVLLDCDCSREGGEDSQHSQLQSDVRAGQGTLTQGLQGLKKKITKKTLTCKQIVGQHRTIQQRNFQHPKHYLGVFPDPQVGCFFSQKF